MHNRLTQRFILDRFKMNDIKEKKHVSFLIQIITEGTHCLWSNHFSNNRQINI